MMKKLLASLLFFLFFTSLQAQLLPQIDAKRYTIIKEPLTTSSGTDIEVTELFWYGCGHCYSIEPHVKNWLSTIPKGVKFSRVPAIFSNRWAFHAKSYYAMDVLGLTQKAHGDFFNDIHKHRKPINNITQLSEFLTPYGVGKEKVESAMNSFAVDNKIRYATKLSYQSGATGVPAFIVDGKYLTTLQLNGSEKKLFETINGLIRMAKKNRPQ